MKRAFILTLVFFISLAYSVPVFAQIIPTEVKTGGYVQVRYTTDETTIDEFKVRRARLKFSGDLNKNTSFLILFDAVTTPILWKAHIDVSYKPWISLRMGQFKTPFSNEYLTSSAKLTMIDRSQVVSNLATKYDIGLQVSGSYSRIKYAVGIFNGSGKNASDENNAKDVVGMLTFKPIREIEAGISHYRGKSGMAKVKKQRTGAYVASKSGPLSFDGEYIFAKDGPAKQNGWFLQVGYSFLSNIQGLVRYDTYDPDKDVSDDTSDILIMGLNVFIQKNAKLQLNYLMRDDSATGDALKAQFQTTF